MLDRYRKKADWILEPIAERVDMKPNTLTFVSLLFAALAGICFYFSHEFPFFLLIIPPLILANGFLDALDGKVARLRNKESKKGDFIDHAIDRFADVFIVGGVAVSSWCTPLVGAVAISAMLLTSYMGTQAQAVGYGREYGGILGRADRLVILILAPFIQYALFVYDANIFGWSFFQWAMIYFAVVGIITAVQRFLVVLKWFGNE